MLPKLIPAEVLSISVRNPAATLTVYAKPEAGIRPAMIVLPGGGMQFISEPEGEPVCRWYDAHGFQTFLLSYSVGPAAKYPDLLQEVSRAVWAVRRNAKVYGVDQRRIVLCAFSAGAHVATMFATHYHEAVAREGTDVPEGGNAICATVTGYTPTTFEDFAENMSKLPPEMRKRMEEGIRNRSVGGWALLDEPGGAFGEIPSLTSHAAVNAHTPPAFLWQTIQDAPGNAFAYASALKQYGTEFELHYFSDDVRCAAMNFCEALYDTPAAVEPNTAAWPELSIQWLRRQFKRMIEE